MRQRKLKESDTVRRHILQIPKATRPVFLWIDIITLSNSFSVSCSFRIKRLNSIGEEEILMEKGGYNSSEDARIAAEEAFKTITQSHKSD